MILEIIKTFLEPLLSQKNENLKILKEQAWAE